MRVALVLVVLALAAAAAGAERTEVVWEQRFDVAALSPTQWELEGTASLGEGALQTRGAPHEAELNGARSRYEEMLPRAAAGYWLRAEWALVPLGIGRMGQAVSIEEGPFFVTIGRRGARLNRTHHADYPVVEGRELVISCDFNRDTVFSWKIDGEEQLQQPVPAWRDQASAAQLFFGDFREGNGETRWLWARLSRVYPDDALALRLSVWDDPRGVQADEPSAFLVGQASPMEKVFREAADFGGRCDPHIRIAAAGRERESFQLTVLPVGRSLHGVRAQISDLLDEDGETRLSAEHVSWHPVGYVQTKPSNSSLRRAGWWWPDILLMPEPFDVEVGYLQPVWFTVEVPAGQKAGSYRGLITLRADGEEPQTVGLELTVRPFSLPLRGKLKTAFSICAGMWEIWYKPEEVKHRLGVTDEDEHELLYTSYECEDVLPHGKWLEMYDFLLAHRLSPTTIYSFLKQGRARVVPAREDMEYCYERGMNATCLGYVDRPAVAERHGIPVDAQDPESTEKELRELEAWLADWDRFIQEKDWPDFTWYVHGFDESDGKRDHAETIDPLIRRVYGMIGEKFPRITRESANPFNPAHIGLFDIWTPTTRQWQPELQERPAAGEEVWAYVCAGPLKPYANFFLDYSGVDPRILPWQYYQHGVTGFLYYLINHYEPQENWNGVGPKWPERPWNPLSYGTNSDGILIYPGPDATPLASTRLENLRDGIEDYEALAMLAELADRLEAQGGQEALLARAREVLRVRPEVSSSWTEYALDPQVIVQARAEVDSLIEAAMRALGDL